MALITNFNPNFPTVYGLEDWDFQSKFFNMTSYNNVWALKFKTPASWGAAKTVDALRFYVDSAWGVPKWMIQFFKNDLNPNDPNDNTFLGALHGAPVAAIHRAGLPVVRGWNRYVVNGQAKNNGYPYSSYPVTIVPVVFDPDTEYWILVAPQKDVNEGYANSNTTNGSIVRFHSRVKSFGDKFVTAFSYSRASDWKTTSSPISLSNTLVPGFVIEFTDGTKYGWPYAATTWVDNIERAGSATFLIERKWKEVSPDYQQLQVFTVPSGLTGTLKQLEFMAGWGTRVSPTDDLHCKMYPTLGGGNLFDEIVAFKSNKFFKDTSGIALGRVRATLTANPTVTIGVSYTLEFYSNTDVRFPWQVGSLQTATSDAVINALKFGDGSVLSLHKHRFRGGSPVTDSNRVGDLQHTLATVPAAPSGLTVTYDAATRSILVNWTDSVDSAHEHYKLFRKLHGTTDWEVLADEVSVSQFSDYTIGAGKLYDYAVVDVRA